jgi:selenide,water dikinase
MSEIKVEIPKLTAFSPGAGCGCKISPKDLDTILKSEITYAKNPNLLVGNDKKDDAAVFDIGGGKAIISTTDFFTPIVDDPYDFGRIASVNAISDIYAMGGKPLMAIAILGWPVDKLPLDAAQKVLEGARKVCDEAGISLAGGHSIEIGDPVFGLAVTGIIDTEKVKQNSGATAGCSLFLTKPLGIGIMATAEKQKKITDEDRTEIVRLMSTLNKVGEQLSNFSSVKSITDVTGFGLIGHLLEICEASNLNAVVEFDKVPKIKNLDKYIELKTFPGGLFKNFNSYGHKVHEITKMQRNVLCDAQTSGGLLVAVAPEGVEEVVNYMKNINHEFNYIGKLTEQTDKTKLIQVI